MQTILTKLQQLGNPERALKQQQVAINTSHAYGVSMPDIRKLAKQVGKDHLLALELWATGIHEARILASIIDIPKLVTPDQMDNWVQEFDSWDVCDQCCTNLFAKTPYAYQKVYEWSERPEEFVRRAAFSLIAALATHDKKASNDKFIPLLTLIKNTATDERNFVKKGVNWALREIGERNLKLNKIALSVAEEIKAIDNKTAHWIATDAIRALTTGTKITKLRAKTGNPCS